MSPAPENPVLQGDIIQNGKILGDIHPMGAGHTVFTGRAGHQDLLPVDLSQLNDHLIFLLVSELIPD